MNFLKFFPRNIVSNTTTSNKIHAAVINAIVTILTIAEEDTSLLLLELCITTATGMWLNEWGSWFGVSRTIDEGDSLYSARIISSIQLPKVTVPALKSNVSSYLSKKYNVELTSDDISIFEPYTRIKAFSKKGKFSGDCRYPDGTYWRGNVIDIIIPENSDKNLIKLIENVKAAGIRVYFTQIQNAGIVVDDPDTLVDTSYSETVLKSECYVPIHILDNTFSGTKNVLRKFSGNKNLWYEKYSELDLEHYIECNTSANSPVVTLPDIDYADIYNLDINATIEAQSDAEIILTIE